GAKGGDVVVTPAVKLAPAVTA
ncbi:MAG: hypothetical protein RL585_139, partial [Pseudomonadota bacterium]